MKRAAAFFAFVIATWILGVQACNDYAVVEWVWKDIVFHRDASGNPCCLDPDDEYPSSLSGHDVWVCYWRCGNYEGGVWQVWAHFYMEGVHEDNGLIAIEKAVCN